MWEENSFRQMSGERLRSEQSPLNRPAVVPTPYLDGVEEGLKVAEEIASWMDGQNRTAALKQIDRERKRIKSNFRGF